MAVPNPIHESTAHPSTRGKANDDHQAGADQHPTQAARSAATGNPPGAGLSIEHLARLLGRGATTVQRLETGTANTIRISDLEGICELCNAEEKLAGLVKLAEEAGSPTKGGGISTRMH